MTDTDTDDTETTEHCPMDDFGRLISSASEGAEAIVVDNGTQTTHDGIIDADGIVRDPQNNAAFNADNYDLRGPL